MTELHSIMLKDGQYLSDVSLLIEKNKSVLIKAGTGIGKTSMVMEKLPKDFDIIVMIVPSVLKVTELEHSYAKSYGKIKYHFYYDKTVPTEMEFKDKVQHVVVCTYDKTDAVAEVLSQKQLDSAVLVVDECHKLYSSGDYRDEAINKVILNIKQQKFKTVLYLTATFTSHCFDTLGLPILDQIYQIDLEKVSLKRSIEMILLQKGDQYSFISLIANRLVDMKKQGVRKKIIVRHNNREKCERIAAATEKYFDVKALVIHSKNKNDQEVKELFRSQLIPKDVDIIFTTSITDEAVNINNLDGDIDSVFVIGKQAHPEELVQFQGRLRKTTVPCFMVIHTGIDENHQVNIDTLKTTYLDKNAKFINRLNKVAELLSEIFDDYTFDMYDEDQQITSIYKRVNLLNETFNEFSGAKLFTVHNGKVERNAASIAANYYRMDKANCYTNFYYFKHRIEELLPSCNVRYRLDHSTTTQSYIKEYLSEQKEINNKAYKESVPIGFEIFLSKIASELQEILDIEESGLAIEEDDFSDQLNEDIDELVLKDFGLDILKQQKNDDRFIDKMVAKYDVPYHAATVDIVGKIAVLSTVIGNLNDIYHIIETRQFDKVMVASKAYSSNIVVQYLVKRFYRYAPERYLHGKYRLTPIDAAKLLHDAIGSINQQTNIPFKTFIKEKLISGVKVDFKTKKVVIDPSKAANFIAKFFAVNDRNAKKPELRYLEFSGIAFGGYQYLSIAKIQAPYLQVPEEFQLGERIFNSMTGIFISGSESSLKLVSPLYDEIDVFDDGMDLDKTA